MRQTPATSRLDCARIATFSGTMGVANNRVTPENVEQSFPDLFAEPTEMSARRPMLWEAVGTEETALLAQHKIFNGVLAAPLTIDRTSYARATGVATEVDLFAHSVGTATIVATATGLPTTTLTKDATSGRFFAKIMICCA